MPSGWPDTDDTSGGVATLAGLGGGTEHATAIFYGEKGVAGGRAPVAHEVAHQGGGNAVTEKDWDDGWLSEEHHGKPMVAFAVNHTGTEQ